MSAIIKNKTAQNVLLLLALGLLVGAVAMKLHIANANPFNEIIAMLDTFGYTAREEELYVEGEYRDATIQSILRDADLTQAVAASREAGFPSRVEETGDVVLILLATREEEIVTLYYLNGQPELCFVQTADSHAVKPLGEEQS